MIMDGATNLALACYQSIDKVQGHCGRSDAGSTSSRGKDTSDVKDDIATRKREAQQWISEWREDTGGK